MALPNIIPIDDLPTDFLQSWLVQTAAKYDCRYMLALAEDGVIWGRFDSGVLTNSHEIFGAPHCSAALRATTLWEARLFGANSEVLIWKEEGIWHARVIQDDALDEKDYIVEQQMLWGDHAEQRDKGFTLLADGREGLRHAVPIDVPDSAFNAQTDGEQKRALRPVALRVHHYINFDDAGNARIVFSRLVDVK